MPPQLPQPARSPRHGLGRVCGVLQSDPVDRLVGGIENSHGEPVDGLRLDRVGHVEHKRLARALMPAYVDPVEPNVGQIIDIPKPQQVAALGVGVAGGVKSRQYQATPWYMGNASWMMPGTLAVFASAAGFSHHFCSRPTFLGSGASNQAGPSKETTAADLVAAGSAAAA